MNTKAGVCSYFKCDGCGKIKPMEQRNIKKVAFSVVKPQSEEHLVCNIYYVQICLSCIGAFVEVKSTEVEKNKL